MTVLNTKSSYTQKRESVYMRIKEILDWIFYLL